MIYNPRYNVLKLGRKGDGMDKKCFEEFGFVSTGWKEGILIVRVEIPLSKIKGFAPLDMSQPEISFA